MTKIMIDPGHGGKDPGAVGNGLQEKELTLDIAKRIKRILETEYTGVQVRLTRETDTYLDLSQRAKLANQWGADFFLSIHINAGGGTGWESYRYTAASSRTAAIHDTIHAAVIAAVGAGIKDRGKKAANFAVLRETKMPALLTENMFIDHAQDAVLLKEPSFREKLARGHVLGLEKAFGLKKKGSPGSTTSSGTSVPTGPFVDVPPDHWAADAIRIVKEAGLMTGREDGTFGPNDPVTRAQLAAILARLMKD